MVKKNRVVVNILMLPITERAARNVAHMLKRMHYEQATIENCRRRSPLEIAAFFQPLDHELQMDLVRRIAEVAGLMPTESEGEHEPEN